MSENRLLIMMNQLSSAYSDEKVTQMPKIKEMIFNAAQELEKTENTKLVAAKLCQVITLSYLENKQEFPEAVIKLYYQLKHDAEIYQGTAMSAMLLPLWF
ncbi:bacteriocin immunity protein [Enterococcus thailandicus]|uniref:bacteriocin immunity protein n=1 Tax=Enterococcus thailandicus TaxID=417368 RepID=UPI0022EC0CB2|nr:bacteriocin immunity protein [Enterococcus thailandicus]MDA3973668.1 bacteriocin immunity protein [Enterococcus thailandicus]MDA3975749.1 bacteriocin immunity protein [Enterococcus thailandicus]MDA3981125.1 bacteriocin immunity protein [Enterococcus thailandicus]